MRYCKNVKIIAVSIWIVNIFLSKIAYSQMLNNSLLFDKCIPKISYEKKIIRKRKIVREDANRVAISLFQNFSDTVKIFINDSLAFNQFVTYDSSIVSSIFTEITFLYTYINQANSIIILYPTSKKSLHFLLDKGYPLYTVHTYSDGTCWIAARKNSIVIK